MTDTIVHRIEVRSKRGAPDPRSAAALAEARSAETGAVPQRIDVASVYLVEGALTEQQIRDLAAALLTDAVTEECLLGAAPPLGSAVVEVHPLPGVMDPDAEAIQQAIGAMLGVDVQVRTGRRFDMHGIGGDEARRLAARCLANPVIQGIAAEPYHPAALPKGQPWSGRMADVPIDGLDDEALARLSRTAHLFLSVEEMRAIQAHYREQGRAPREIELETIAQTWSEHCVHKTLKATYRYREVGDGEPSIPGLLSGAIERRPGHGRAADGTITIDNLLKSTVAAATHALIADGVDWCLSVFVDNAGVIAFDDEHAVCFKVETHNHPSAIEPYGGAATGIGGCIRDIIGTGRGAEPIAATDVFCVAPPEGWTDGRAAGAGRPLPAGCLHPRRILRQVVAGVRDYGNRMGIPTLNGAVWFDDDYVGNPLVYCGCVGVMPRSCVTGAPAVGDRIIALGGRTGRDGIHGATFSSAELTDAHADEFSHAVQIGNAVTEKKMLDVILEARDLDDGLFRAITDCGAGGFSSAVGEMGAELGAEVHLDRAPLKYAGLSPTEIWISEAQERMVLAVPPEKLDALRDIAERHDVEWCDLGVFGTDDRTLRLHYAGEEIGRLSMAFLHDGLPPSVREATWTPPAPPAPRESSRPSTREALLALLAHPNIASKHWIIRQYDHEVQGRSVVRPLVGPRSQGPGDAAVVLPVRGSTRALAIGNGLATGWSRDPYLMALAAIDECVRNLVCVGADPERIAILDNFCWPGCADPQSLGALVRAAEGCYDGAIAYRTPFISGKDSLNNQYTTEDGATIRIPPTLLVSGFGIVPDGQRAMTMDAKRAGSLLLAVGATSGAMGGSHYELLFGALAGSVDLPRADLAAPPRTARRVHELIRRGLVRAAHDCSEGGLLVAAAEMALAGDLGLELDLLALPADDGLGPTQAAFAETPGRYLLEVDRDHLPAIDEVLGGAPYAIVGEFSSEPALVLAGRDLRVPLEELRAAWRGTLDW